ncbi:hypothetical protein H7H82_17265 [Mycobacterium heidelbergense]|nr:hypothetical protein [Mycobacterium heidelbergense]MCV7052320.1 hypothetical protein [Mycobacterium heidelbergense]
MTRRIGIDDAEAAFADMTAGRGRAARELDIAVKNLSSWDFRETFG